MGFFNSKNKNKNNDFFKELNKPIPKNSIKNDNWESVFKHNHPSIFPINPDAEKIEFKPKLVKVNKIWEENLPNSQNTNFKEDSEISEISVFSKCNENNIVEPIGHPFLDSLYLAYQNHLNLRLTPDDVWFQIITEFAELINNNAEKYRNMFVEHEGQKDLIVELDCENWELFLENICDLINKNTKNNLSNDFIIKFSESNSDDIIMQQICIMHSAQKYFRYVFNNLCGIRNVELTGTIDDWEKIVFGANNLKNKYKEICGDWLDKLIPVLEKFVETKKGIVDFGFWNRIMRDDFELIGHLKGGYGMEVINYITGWSRYFFPNNMNNNNLEINSFKKITMNCPIMYNDKKHFLKTTFIGYQYKNEYIYPVRSYCLTKIKE
jgi:hypothetical protein